MLSTLVSFLTLAALATASPLAERQSGVQTVRNCNNQGQVALTFDDGAYIYERDVAGALNGGKGTFFLNGNNYDCIYNHVDEIRYLDSQQHTLGSHTWSHKDLTTLSYDELHDEFWRVEEAFIRILGKKPLYFRPPYGSINDLVLQVAGERGYKKAILWSDDTEDASGSSVGFQQGIMDGVINSYPSPHMVLQHSVLDTTAGVVGYAAGQLQGKGYDLVAVDVCLGSDGEYPYQYVGEPGVQDGSWTC